MDPSLVQLSLPAVSGLTGVLVGAWLSSRRDRSQKRLAFVEKQLASFYSPMLGIRQEIASTSLICMRIQEEASKAWADLADRDRMSKTHVAPPGPRREELAGFYEHIAQVHDRLRSKLEAGVA